MKTKLIALVLLGCFSCIGVDRKDAIPRDPVLSILSGGKLTTTDKSGVPMEKGNMGILALQVGEKQTVSLEFFNQFGVRETPTVVWTIEKPTVASVINNEITALSSGNTQIGLTSGGATASIGLTVVGDANAIASVVVTLPLQHPLPLYRSINPYSCRSLQKISTAKTLPEKPLSGLPKTVRSLLSHLPDL